MAASAPGLSLGFVEAVRLVMTTSRRAFLRQVGIAGSAWAMQSSSAGAEAGESDKPNADSRAFWLKMLTRVASPVLENLAANRLRERMPVECAPGHLEDRRKVTHLEALGRTLSGMAPWLELREKSGREAEAGRRWADLARQGLANATDPAAADYLDFKAGGQCLVDAAFLAHALLRAPRELWGKLQPPVQQRVIESLKLTRTIKPGNNNWLLFSAMIETFLAAAGSEWLEQPIDHALRSHEQWYKGDGVYGDGPEFHWDYYNGYVIQPFMIDVLEKMGKVTDRWAGLLSPGRRRARRYAAIQERLIAPDGSYPVLGRSICYRCGAFQLLAQMALRDELPAGLTPARVRSALSAVIHRTLEAPGVFDDQGWLTIGLAGHQPGLGESYISTGSLYLCTFVFLPLGLPADHPFWTGPAADWTSRLAWAGQNLPADHAL
jgi:hypothetical protein